MNELCKVKPASYECLDLELEPGSDDVAISAAPQMFPLQNNSQFETMKLPL